MRAVGHQFSDVLGRPLLHPFCSLERFHDERPIAGVGEVVCAFIAASGVILTPEQATELASTKWSENRELRAALLDQSAKAWWGLMVIAVGTGMQVVGTI
jgi:hypothetical protein